MPTGTVSPAIREILTKASKSGEPAPISPEYAREIMENCRFSDVGQNGRSMKTVPELLEVMRSGSWEPFASEVSIAQFPDRALRVLNGHNRLNAISELESPVKTRVRLFDVNDNTDFNLLYSRFDTATSIRGFSHLSRLRGAQVPNLPFSGKGPGGSKKVAPPVAAAFIVESRFGENDRPIGIDGWIEVKEKYVPYFQGLKDVAAPCRARSGNTRALRAFDGIHVLSVFLAMWAADRAATECFIRRLLGAEGGVDDTVRSRVWGPLGSSNTDAQWLQARAVLHLNVIKAWSCVLKGKRVGWFRSNPTGEYPIEGTDLVYRTNPALLAWKRGRQ